jgi:hypothetical protein
MAERPDDCVARFGVVGLKVSRDHVGPVGWIIISNNSRPALSSAVRRYETLAGVVVAESSSSIEKTPFATEVKTGVLDAWPPPATAKDRGLPALSHGWKVIVALSIFAPVASQRFAEDTVVRDIYWNSES